jgi:hypothetical protein
MIIPTIGRRVWYWPAGINDYDMQDIDGIRHAFDAGIVYVHNERLVNVVVTDHLGFTHRRKNVTLIQPGDEIPQDKPRCEWMPFQTQAAKQQDTQPSQSALERIANALEQIAKDFKET